MISAIVHTYNEEKNLDRCLKSLSFAQEIIVIDMGSTDDTLKIAKTYKAAIYQHPYTQFVEPARNFGIGKAKYDWVCILDADEEVPSKLGILLQKNSKKNSADYYQVPRKNIIFGKWIKHTGWWPDYQIRFFKKGYVQWSEKIHGIPVTKGKGQDIQVSDEYSIIHHHYNSLDQYIQRLNRYTSITAKERISSMHEKSPFQSIISKPSGEFVKRFFLQQGYKDGLHGLALSLLQSFYELLVILKIWEMNGFKQEQIKLNELETMFHAEFVQKQYWQCDTVLKQSNSHIKKIIWRFKRKFHLYE
jgi:(heptosyl)LPS beta-1,4-glucosyltransferase